MKMPDLSWPAGLLPEIAADQQTLARHLAEFVARELSRAIDRDGRASLAVPGGSTPVQFFRALRTQALDWARVEITLTDERWVPQSSEDSNARLVNANLLQDRAAAATFYPLKLEGASALEGQSAAERALDQLKWPLDVVILGMGSDGHTASLFPDAPELSRALDPGNSARSIAMTPPSQSTERLSLTRSALIQARSAVLLIHGTDKLATLEEAFARSDEQVMPIRAFLKPGLRIFWSP
ncbi:6-phosphogluconolactonase [Marinobacter salicampi]|uniref:6-phosphogluconolactonase n=1 Tax=Marinobacter salicampi TaxID=435907 RepID=UPI00140775D3|nr:6-phosphogluconolactonase [Marinobacter salicampi]